MDSPRDPAAEMEAEQIEALFVALRARPALRIIRGDDSALLDRRADEAHDAWISRCLLHRARLERGAVKDILGWG